MRTPALCLSLLLVACSGGTEQAGDKGTTSNLDDSDQACAVTFHFLQKDAYANRAGRTTTLWPPHTTTTITATCAGQDPISAYRENHGTLPDATDANGTPILVETKTVGPVTASLARTQALLAAYKDCECAPTTAFLSMEALDQQQLVDLANALGTYVEQNLSCDGIDVTQVGGWLQTGDFDDVLSSLSSCSWTNGDDWQTGFDDATQSVLQGQAAQYHVCNNDGELESALFDTFSSGAAITACDSTSALCAGPKWFYNP